MEKLISLSQFLAKLKPAQGDRVGYLQGWSKLEVLSRLKAAGVHIILSALVAVSVTMPVVIWLYPSPFFQAAGGMHLLGLILMVDVVLGPLLTFLVFDKRKSSLKLDLAIIGFCQVMALIYGLYATSLSRPVFMTFVVDRFEMVSAAQVDDEELKKAPEGFREVRWGHPQVAYAERPSDPEERSTLLFASLHGIDLGQTFRYYRPLEHGLEKIVERAKPISDLKKFNDPKLVDEILSPYRGKVELGFVPMQGKKRDLTALINSKSGLLIEVVNLRPWP